MIYVDFCSYVDVYFRYTADGVKGSLDTNVLKPTNNKKVIAKRKQTHLLIKVCNYS